MKILIWNYNIPIKNSGGPSGYLYNIKQYIDNEDPQYKQQIVFLSDLITFNPSKQSSSLFKKLYVYLTHDIQQIIKWYLPSQLDIQTNTIDLNLFDIIHFHSTQSLNEAYNLLKEKHFHGKIVLTSHSPQPATEEMINGFSLLGRCLKKIYISKLFKKEITIWEKADYIMFPVKNALEPYTKYSIFYNFYSSFKEKFIYCPTGILNLNKNEKVDPNIIKEKIGIPKDSFLISYIGRHNKIKGFDVLKDLGKQILIKDTQNKIFFAIGGQEYPIKRLNHPHWKELGWINYSNDLIAASDLFILPNKETYFDLIALEVLRTGTPILMTETGGNKYFKSIIKSQFKYGIFFFKPNITSIEEISSIIKDLQDPSFMMKCRYNNKMLFDTHFEMGKFMNRYTSLINTL